jgi:hypothetical protein
MSSLEKWKLGKLMSSVMALENCVTASLFGKDKELIQVTTLTRSYHKRYRAEIYMMFNK